MAKYSHSATIMSNMNISIRLIRFFRLSISFLFIINSICIIDCSLIDNFDNLNIHNQTKFNVNTINHNNRNNNLENRVKRQSNDLTTKITTLSTIESDFNIDDTSTIKSTTNKLSFTSLIKIDDDFKPIYDGTVITKNGLNLTDRASKASKQLDYYDNSENNDDEEDEEEEDDDDINNDNSSSTTSMPSDFDDDDIEMAMGGLTGIVQRILRGPNRKQKFEKPEDIYVVLNHIIHAEFDETFKKIIPRIYDYQYDINNRISQRCFNSLVQFFRRLRKHYIWPYRMLEASANPISLNKFALRQYGDFDSCLNIVANEGNEILFTGQYCMLQVILPLPKLKSKHEKVHYYDKILDFNQTELYNTFSENYLRIAAFLYSNPLSYALCLPSTCLPYEIENIGNFFLNRFKIHLHRTLDCYSKYNLTMYDNIPIDSTKLEINNIQRPFNYFLKELNGSQIFAILFTFISICIVVSTTLYDIYLNHFNENSSINRHVRAIVVCFSIRYSIEKIFNVHQRYRNQQNIMNNSLKATSESMFNTVCLDALKSMALAWICLSNFYLLGYQSQMVSSLPHLYELVMSLRGDFMFQIILQSWLSFEIFFTISGFLMAYTFLPYIAMKEGKPFVIYLFFKRIIRLMPSMFSIVFLIKLLALWKNAGPLYNSGVHKILHTCNYNNILKSFLFISNLFGYDKTCLPHLWYISNEFQLFFIGQFVLIFVYNRRKHAARIFIILILIGILSQALITYRMRITSLMIDNAIIEQTIMESKSLHLNTIVHFQTYFLGMALGYYYRMNKMKQFDYNFIMKIIITIIIFSLSTIYVIYIPLMLSNYYDHIPNTTLILYYSTSRLMFIGPTIWIMINIQRLKSTNLIIKLFSWSIFRICSHLCFQIYLLNLIVIWIYYFTKRTLIDINIIESFPVAMSLFILTVIISMFTYLIFEAPYRNLFCHYFEQDKSFDKNPNSNENNNNNYNYNKQQKTIEDSIQMKHYDNSAIDMNS